MRLWKVSQTVMMSKQFAIVCTPDDGTGDEAIARAINAGDISLSGCDPVAEELTPNYGVVATFYESGD